MLSLTWSASYCSICLQIYSPTSALAPPPAIPKLCIVEIQRCTYLSAVSLVSAETKKYVCSAVFLHSSPSDRAYVIPDQDYGLKLHIASHADVPPLFQTLHEPRERLGHNLRSEKNRVCWETAIGGSAPNAPQLEDDYGFPGGREASGLQLIKTRGECKKNIYLFSPTYLV